MTDPGVDVSTPDLGFPTQQVVVLREDAPRPREPAVGARVVVEDCATGSRYEAVTDVRGVATVRDDGGSCWNVTAVVGDEARSVVGGPVPLPGPIVFPYEAAPGSQANVRWEVSLVDYEGGYVHADVPGTSESYGTRGIAARDAVQREPIATLVIAQRNPDVRGALVPLRRLPDGNMLGELQLPLPASPLYRARLVVHMPAYWYAYGWEHMPRVERRSFRVLRTTPSGARLAVGPPSVPSGTGALSQFDLSLHWTDIPGTEAWSQPLAGGVDGPVRWRDTCRDPLVSWSDVPVEDGGRADFAIPEVTVREISGETLETLRVLIGGPGHRTRMVLRTSGSRPFEWTVEPFEPGAVALEGLPPLPSGVADGVGLSRSSVHVQVGAASPAASYDSVDEAAPVLNWWIREGFVFGEASDFDGVVASCPVRGPR